MDRKCKNCLLVKPIEDFYRHSCGFKHTCKSCIKKASSVWQKENKEKRMAIVKKSRCKNDKWKDYINGWKKTDDSNRKSRAAIKIRTPAWLSVDDRWMIREAYSLSSLRSKITGVKHHVDHIYPIRGDVVSGLHVPSNLQVIPAVANMKKGNRILL